MVDYGCDNGRLFCALLTMVEKPVLTERKENKWGKNKLSVCNPAKAGCFYVMCWRRAQCSLRLWIWIPVRGITHAQHPITNPLSSTASSLHTHTHLVTYKGVLRGTPGHCSVFLLYSMILGVIQIHKQCCRHFSVFQKMPTEYIKWVFWLEFLILKRWIRN